MEIKEAVELIILAKKRFLDDSKKYEALHIAKEVLEKQIPKMPNSDDNGGYPENFESWIECPVCGETVPEYVEENETECYCLRCGQKLAWEKE